MILIIVLSGYSKDVKKAIAQNTDNENDRTDKKGFWKNVRNRKIVEDTAT